ncbi:MAG: hypothetical protein ACI4PM_07930 [Butyricicoccus sp.]
MKYTKEPENLNEYYTRDSQGTLHLNVPSVLFGGYDPMETGIVVEKINTYYRNIIVDLIAQMEQKDRELSRLRAQISESFGS